MMNLKLPIVGVARQVHSHEQDDEAKTPPEPLL